MPGDCAHCGLPLGRRAFDATVGGVVGRYCCVGCVLAHQVTRSRGDDGHAGAVLVRLGLALFFAMNVMMVTMPSYVPVIYGEDGTATDGPLFLLLRWLAALFTAPVLLLLGGPILQAAWRAARSGVVAADALVVLATLAAYGLSIANTAAGRPAVYFDTATMLLVLVTLGRYLDARARAEAGRLVRQALGARTPAQRVGSDGTVTAVAAAVLAPGDLVRVTPGDLFPTDGTVVTGVGGVDEAALTGEARPVVKHAGDAVTGGSCSIDGTFHVRVTAAEAVSTTARIARLVDAGLRARTRAEELADRVAGTLVPVIATIAVGAGLWWTRAEGLDRGVVVALAILVVACPCGLGLATPLAVWTGMVAAARRGVIVRNGAVLERLATVRTVLLDKTGTLTTTEPRLVRVDSHAPQADVVAMAAGLERHLPHPVARGIVTGARRLGIAPAACADVDVVPGHGVRGVVGGRAVAVGDPAWVAMLIQDDRVPDAADGIPVTVAVDGALAGVVWLEESLESGAEVAVQALRQLGLRVGVLTGDVRTTVLRRLFGDDAVWPGLRPEDKIRRIETARVDGPVAMVGDGFNDAPALAVADVGIAVGAAADLTRTTADVVVRRGGIAHVPWLIGHARRVRRVAGQNLAWAFGYNALAVGLAAAGRLEPVVAALAMLASSATVVANARRIARDAPAPAPVGLASELSCAT